MFPHKRRILRIGISVCLRSLVTKLKIENRGANLKNAASAAKSVPKDANLTSKVSIAEFISDKVKGSLSLVPNLTLIDYSPNGNPSVTKEIFLPQRYFSM